MSEREVRQLYDEALSYRRQLSEMKWLVEGGAANRDSPQPGPADLFAGTDRPLVVGLFGGTGVGKSSLLNRLADADIARTGVARPTSMEITVYLHDSVEIAALPAEFPQQSFSENRHHHDKFASVMWVDMPDFDSDETQNRELVKQWLPHIDLLLYVVSPERYKDQQGWQLLLQHGYRHAWLFVMNHWDRAQDIQREDFVKLLSRAGFESPKIFRTVCSGDLHPQDEFAQLEGFVAGLSERKYISQLDEHGWLNRLQELSIEIDGFIDLLEGADKPATLLQSFEDDLRQIEVSAQSNLELPFKNFGQQFAEKKISPLLNVYKSLKGESGAAAVNLATQQVASRSEVAELWDDWSTTRLDDALLRFERGADRHGYPASRLQATTARLQTSAVDLVKEKLRTHLNLALLKPGSQWQRLTVTVAGYLQLLLPLLVLCWIVYRAFDGFINGAEDRAAYVGVDFLINGLILTVISWLVPWLLAQLLKPSLPDAVSTAMHTAVTTALEEVEVAGKEQLGLIAAERNDLLQKGLSLRQRIASLCDRSAILEDPELNQLLLSRQHPGV